MRDKSFVLDDLIKIKEIFNKQPLPFISHDKRIATMSHGHVDNDIDIAIFSSKIRQLKNI